MPREARLDAPGLLHHVRARGIERRKIFVSDYDRRDFMERLEYACGDGAAAVYAFCLMPNHIHLSIRTGEQPLATTMRRLLTAYATSFNRRHKRDGHLFQNRFKSTVVDEERYFLALVRYIHLNPLRARILENMDTLKSYPWCGHSVLMGKSKLACMDTDAVLGRFGAKAGAARRELIKFMTAEDAGKEGRIFKGGGLVRSAGRMKALREISQKERWAYDERILGTGAVSWNLCLQKRNPLIRCWSLLKKNVRNGSSSWYINYAAQMILM
jgi:putative transposase